MYNLNTKRAIVGKNGTINWVTGSLLLLMIFFWRWFAFAGMSSSAYWAVVLALVQAVADVDGVDGARVDLAELRDLLLHTCWFLITLLSNLLR